MSVVVWVWTRLDPHFGAYEICGLAPSTTNIEEAEKTKGIRGWQYQTNCLRWLCETRDANRENREELRRTFPVSKVVLTECFECVDWAPSMTSFENYIGVYTDFFAYSVFEGSELSFDRGGRGMSTDANVWLLHRYCLWLCRLTEVSKHTSLITLQWIEDWSLDMCSLFWSMNRGKAYPYQITILWK